MLVGSDEDAGPLDWNPFDKGNPIEVGIECQNASNFVAPHDRQMKGVASGKQLVRNGNIDRVQDVLSFDVETPIGDLRKELNRRDDCLGPTQGKVSVNDLLVDFGVAHKYLVGIEE